MKVEDLLKKTTNNNFYLIMNIDNSPSLSADLDYAARLMIVGDPRFKSTVVSYEIGVMKGLPVMKIEAVTPKNSKKGR